MKEYENLFTPQGWDEVIDIEFHYQLDKGPRGGKMVGLDEVIGRG